jgi:hypothetical protein
MSSQPETKQFYASLIEFNAQTKTAKLYIMNTSKNRNGWGVTAKALDEASPTIKGKPIGMGKGHKPGHYKDAESMDSGKFVTYENKTNYLLAEATIEDQETVSMINAGTLGPVSVVIHVFNVACSKCGKTFTTEENPHDHEHLKNGEAYEQVQSFRFHRVDFVDTPAYPQAGLMEMAENQNPQQALTFYAGFYESQGEKKPNSTEETQMADTIQKDPKIEELTAELDKTRKELEASTKKAEANESAAKELKARLDKIEKEAHDALVNETYQARKQAGLAGKEDEERTMLTAQTDAVLKMLKTDAEKTAKLTASATTTTGPKIQFTAKAKDDLTEAIKQKRAELGFAPKTKEEQ